MSEHSRRDFLADVGRGMLVASLGPAVAFDLGLAHAEAGEAPKTLAFGTLEPLVALLQETPSAKLLPALVKKMNDGTDLRTLVAAGALANARTFGGEDYTGFHAFMALAPALAMAGEMPEGRAALPVLKVLYRNTTRIHGFGGRKAEVLRPVEPAALPSGKPGGAVLREATHKANVTEAEKTFAALAKGKPEDAYNDLQLIVEDDIDVHRVVLAWRAWATLDLTGKTHAHTLLRQSVRYCVNSEKYWAKRKDKPGIRAALPKLLDTYKLPAKATGKRRADAAWVEKMGQVVLTASRDRAAEVVAGALAEGFALADVAEAISLAATQLVLRDPGRPAKWSSPGKPPGSVHGDSVGVHASDAANAWRNIAKVSNARNAVASLIVAAYHTAGQLPDKARLPYPWDEHLEKVKAKDGASLLRLVEGAIKEKDQPGACAGAAKYLALGSPTRPLLDLLLRYAVSEDGALHHEKYYRTVTEEYAATRPAFRNPHLVALARVTASGYGFPAPGFAEACKLLKG
jgi:hypothetical protein